MPHKVRQERTIAFVRNGPLHWNESNAMSFYSGADLHETKPLVDGDCIQAGVNRELAWIASLQRHVAGGGPQQPTQTLALECWRNKQVVEMLLIPHSYHPNELGFCLGHKIRKVLCGDITVNRLLTDGRVELLCTLTGWRHREQIAERSDEAADVACIGGSGTAELHIG